MIMKRREQGKKCRKPETQKEEEKMKLKKHVEHLRVERAELRREGRLEVRWMRANDDRAH